LARLGRSDRRGILIKAPLQPDATVLICRRRRRAAAARNRALKLAANAKRSINMILIRRDPSPKKDEWPDDLQQQEFRVEKDEDWDLDPENSTIRVDFKRFGRGTEKRSHFAVQMNWLDVRGFVREFIEMGHSEALHLERILQLAKAIEREGWTSDSAPEDDFWDILPQRDGDQPSAKATAAV
jgi:hypothetical protein